ncbi:MAG TPA: histidine phosphatase family protein [Burkholderiaceae bacterium]|nr:histidine phosphatase family protein [Burkholderiaceae bacterium]
MGHIYLIRHGQASFGAEDYDQLSPLGHRQSERLGQYLAERSQRLNLTWDAVLTGSLRRHEQTWAGLAKGAGWTHEPTVWPGLNEYDSAALLRALPLDRELEDPHTPGGYKQHFRLLRDALTQWMAGTISPQGMPSYQGFVDGITGALAHIRQQHPQGNVLVVSSGGPIATLVGHVLRTPPETTIELNMQLRNTSVTELMATSHHARLVSFNTLPHLDDAEHTGWVTHA